MFEKVAKPLIIAHRGASTIAPENTIAAFKAAIRQKADGVELDAQLTRDGQVIVFHDSTLDRTSNGTGAVKETDLQAIRALDAGSWFDEKFKNEPVPTLTEVFETVGKKIFINIELKNYAAPFDDLAEKVALQVKRHNIEKHVFFSSFNPFALRAVKRQLPDVPAGLLTLKGMARPWIEKLANVIAPYDAMHPHFSDISPQYVHRINQMGKFIFTWTVNDPQEFSRLTELGVAGIITDDPLLVRDVPPS